jgi:hypothetical protein
MDGQNQFLGPSRDSAIRNQGGFTVLDLKQRLPLEITVAESAITRVRKTCGMARIAFGVGAAYDKVIPVKRWKWCFTPEAQEGVADVFKHRMKW